MKKSLFYTLIAAIAILVCACGGPDKAYSEQFNIKENHPDTQKAYEMVQKDLSMSRPGAKIQKYTYLAEVKPENPDQKMYYLMIAQVKENDKVENIHYYFPDDWAFVTKDIGRLATHNLGLD